MSEVTETQLRQESRLSIKKVGVCLGAEITGVDLTRPLNADTIEAIKQAHAGHGVIVFPNQKISSEDLMRFGRYFGDLSIHPFSTSSDDASELIIYDNKEGNPPLSTDIWHSDETFRECPPMGTILCSKIIPKVGGDTAFASMTAVYEGLSDRMQNYISGLEAIHDFKPFKTLFDKSTKEGRKQLNYFEDLYPPIAQPVVRVHPVTKKKAIFVNPQFTLGIKGMEEQESEFLLNFLYSRTHIREYQYRHRWDTDMLVFWDNRSVQHSAVQDYYPQRRKMERVTICGDRPIADAEPPSKSELRKKMMPSIHDFPDTRLKRHHEIY